MIYTDISGALDPTVFDGVSRHLDASIGPATIRLTGYADTVTGSPEDDVFYVGGDVRSEVFNAWRGGFVRTVDTTDGYDLVLDGGGGADVFKFIAQPYVGIGVFGYTTPGDVLARNFDVGEQRLDFSSYENVFGGVMTPAFEFTEERTLVLELTTYQGRDMGSVTIADTSVREFRQAVLDGEIDAFRDVFADDLFGGA